jgi:hypothetical protein
VGKAGRLGDLLRGDPVSLADNAQDLAPGVADLVVGGRPLEQRPRPGIGGKLEGLLRLLDVAAGDFQHGVGAAPRTLQHRDGVGGAG